MFLAHVIFLYFYEMYMLGGDILFMFLLLFLVSHYATLIIDFIFMRLFMIYIFYFMLCEIKKLFCFTCIFHTCVYVFVECYRNIQVDLVVLLSTLVTNR